jgi:PEP-CTERM motif-containing protein
MMGHESALLHCEALKSTHKKMSIRHTTRRKSERFIPVHRLAWLLLISFAVGVACFAGLHHHQVQPIAPAAQSVASSFLIPSPEVALDQSQRTVYPYSVIPGGVHNVAELKSAMGNDPIVEAHYVEFQVARLRVVRLDRARSLHVSYRIGNRIYWTRGRMNLAKGETVITDGVLMARTRCGNLAADVIPNTSEALTLLNEPTAEALDTPTNSPGADIPSESVPLESFVTPPDSPGLAVEGGPPSSGGTTGISTPGGSTGPGGGGTSPGTGPSGPVPVRPVPEPGSLVLLSIGLLGIIVIRKLV